MLLQHYNTYGHANKACCCCCCISRHPGINKFLWSPRVSAIQSFLTYYKWDPIAHSLILGIKPIYKCLQNI